MGGGGGRVQSQLGISPPLFSPLPIPHLETPSKGSAGSEAVQGVRSGPQSVWPVSSSSEQGLIDGQVELEPVV